MAEPEHSLPATRTSSRWPWLSLLPLGLGAWAPIYAGVRARVALWVGLGVGCTAVTVAGWVLSATTDHGHGRHNTLAGALVILGWVGAVASSFIVRAAYDRRMGSPLLIASEEGQRRLADRDQARRIAADDPALAREMGVGRPDSPGASDAGLVDVNNASAAAIATLPGVDADLATRIVEARARCDGFSSLEDFGMVLDLPGDLVERLRDRAIFLPR